MENPHPAKNGPSGLRDVVAPDVPQQNVDDLDLAILMELTEDSRTSARQLASKLGVSSPTIGDRMSRLERNGVIVRYSAEINWAALGHSQSVYVAVDVSDRSLVAEVLKELWEIPEVETISVVTGQWDLIVRLRVRDYNHMRSILIDRVWEIPVAEVKMTTMMSVAEMPSKDFAHALIMQIMADRK